MSYNHTALTNVAYLYCNLVLGHLIIINKHLILSPFKVVEWKGISDYRKNENKKQLDSRYQVIFNSNIKFTFIFKFFSHCVVHCSSKPCF